MTRLKSIKGFKDYKVSENGEVFSFKFGKAKLLKATENKGGYKIVGLTREKGEKPVSMYVHKLVAEAFIDNDEKGTDVDHIDGNRANNTLSNLRWVTKKGNHQNPIARERHSKANIENADRRPVSKFDLDYNLVDSYNTISEAALSNGLTEEEIRSECMKDCWYSSQGGYIWFFTSRVPTRPNSKQTYFNFSDT